jgi:hypothetical protein
MTTARPRTPLPDPIDVEDLLADPRFADPSTPPDGARIAHLGGRTDQGS